MQTRESTIFVCYSRIDSEFALKLAEDLRAKGVSIWMDQLDISPGDRWDRVTEEALKTCQSILLILSPEAVSSENVLDEIAFALEEKKRILPVLARSCDIPFRIRRLQLIDFTGDYDEGFRHILSTLGIDYPHTEKAVEKRATLEAEKKQRRIGVTPSADRHQVLPGDTARYVQKAEVPLKARNWFGEHLNWTMVIGLLGACLAFSIISTAALSYHTYLEFAAFGMLFGMSVASIVGATIYVVVVAIEVMVYGGLIELVVMGIIITLAIIILVWRFALRRKNRSLWWIPLGIFVPFGWIVLLCLKNKKLTHDASGNSIAD